VRIDRDIDVFLRDLTSISVPSSVKQVEDSIQDTAFKEDERFYISALITGEPDWKTNRSTRRDIMSSILKRPASPGPSASHPNFNPTENYTAKRVKLEESLQDSEELYDPDLDDGLARVGQVSASTESGSNLKEAKAENEADVEVEEELMTVLKRPTGLDKLIALAVSPVCHPVPGSVYSRLREAESCLSFISP
jgi:hypothetical protein